jgi:hypothetical protein
MINPSYCTHNAVRWRIYPNALNSFKEYILRFHISSYCTNTVRWRIYPNALNSFKEYILRFHSGILNLSLWSVGAVRLHQVCSVSALAHQIGSGVIKQWLGCGRFDSFDASLNHCIGPVHLTRFNEPSCTFKGIKVISI